jgi:hypothetical protein
MDKLLISPPELSGNLTSSHIVAKQDKLAKDKINVALRCIFVQTSRASITCRKILRHGTDVFTSPLKEGVLRIFIALDRV